MLGLNQDSILTKYLSVMTCWAAGIVITSPLPTPSACPASQSAGMVHDHRWVQSGSRSPVWSVTSAACHPVNRTVAHQRIMFDMKITTKVATESPALLWSVAVAESTRACVTMITWRCNEVYWRCPHSMYSTGSMWRMSVRPSICPTLCVSLINSSNNGRQVCC